MYRIFKKLDVFVKAYPYLSLIRCLVHYILDSCSMYYFHNMRMILCGHTFFEKRGIYATHATHGY